MADPMLRRVVDVLLGLQMLSEGSTYGWDRTRNTNSTAGAVPVRFKRDGSLNEHEWSPYEFHRWRITSSKTTADLADRINAAEDALETALRGPRARPGDVPLEPAQLRLWVIMDCAGMRSADVASKCGMSVSWVREIRTKARRHPNTGVPLPEAEDGE
jgi:hypothetical protein